ncbi:hypothetical protein [Pseudonocardia sp. TRM90224]|uniref:hypothetical protein n=1 Tax=Pseudonocardia sp. TRM90224 TaxID=2812678 RepID=UPI001E4D9455|nr:hypothetical protein [Pseudonocardia sp. TRM90224]
MSRVRRLGVVLLLLALVSACTVVEPGRASPAGSGTGSAGGAPTQITYDERSATFAPDFVKARSTDVCALLDVEAAEKATGAKRASMRLSTGLATCTLEVDKSRPAAGWDFSLSVGQRLTEGWEQASLAGTKVMRNPDISSKCEYLVPFAAGNVGLRAEISYSQAANTGAQPSDAQVCETGEQYLADVVLPKWKNPPQLAAGLTTPRIPLLGKDPCAALLAAVADIPDDPGEPRTVRLSDPYSCEGESGTAISKYAVEFEIYSAILDLDGEPVQIGDFTTYRTGGIAAGGCAYQVAVLPDLLFSKEEKTIYNGGFTVGVGTCDETDIVQKAIDNLVRQPDAPEPKPGAQLIGDLTGT